MKKQRSIKYFLGGLVAFAGIVTFAQSQTNSATTTKRIDPYTDDRVFTEIAGTNAAENETLKKALKFIGEFHSTQQRPLLPPGLTQSDISNAQYKVIVWQSTVPPKPINFYGKVLDESNEPVSGAIVHFSWDGTVTNRNTLEFRDWPTISAETTSDNNGRFSITGKSGTVLNVSVAKAGYYSSRTNRSNDNFKYSKDNLASLFGSTNYFHPDSNHPVIYYVRKFGIGANTLLTSERGVRDGFWVTVPRDGTAVTVDLLTQKAGTGPLEIRTRKPDYPAHGGALDRLSPEHQAKPSAATNWSFTMKLSGGGFLEEKEEFAFTPPAFGYQPIVTFTFQKGATDWTTEFKRDFYIKFGNPPVYGQLNVDTSSFQQTVILTYVINPDGSRNLEPQQR